MCKLERPLPPEPTDAPPGSAAKVEVMRKRYWRGWQLHHPGDAKMDLGPRRVRAPVFGPKPVGGGADGGDSGPGVGAAGDGGDDAATATGPCIVDFEAAADDAAARGRFSGPDYHAGRPRVGESGCGAWSAVDGAGAGGVPDGWWEDGDGDG